MSYTERYVTTTGSDTYANSTNPATPMAITTAATNATAADRINVKTGTYTLGATLTISGTGTATSGAIWRGYNSTIGDLDTFARNANGTLNTTNFPVLAFSSTFRLNQGSGVFTQFQNFAITGTVSTSLVTLGTDSTMVNCSVANSSTNAAAIGITIGTRCIVYNCDLVLNGASGGTCAAQLINGSGKLVACYVNGGPVVGVQCASTTIVVLNLIVGHKSHGIAMNATSGLPFIAFNTIATPASGGTGDGINILTGTTGLQTIIGNMITDQGSGGTGYGLNGVSAANAIFTAHNRFRDNSQGDTNLATDWLAATGFGKVTSGSGTSDYTNAGSGDFSLIFASPANSAGWPRYMDIGALQRKENAQLLTIPGMSGGFRG